jgi:hypothetical protein
VKLAGRAEVELVATRITFITHNSTFLISIPQTTPLQSIKREKLTKASTWWYNSKEIITINNYLDRIIQKNKIAFWNTTTKSSCKPQASQAPFNSQMTSFLRTKSSQIWWRLIRARKVKTSQYTENVQIQMIKIN